MDTRDIFLLAFLSIFGFFGILGAQSPVGVWKTIDDETGEAKSHIEIFEKDDKLHGKVVKLLQADSDQTCDACPGEKKDRPIQGLEIMWDLEENGKEWTDGEIMDPANGKVYSCKIYLEGKDVLKVRGYLGFSAFGRTQEWQRIN